MKSSHEIWQVFNRQQVSWVQCKMNSKRSALLAWDHRSSQCPAHVSLGLASLLLLVFLQPPVALAIGACPWKQCSPSDGREWVAKSPASSPLGLGNWRFPSASYKLSTGLSLYSNHPQQPRAADLQEWPACLCTIPSLPPSFCLLTKTSWGQLPKRVLKALSQGWGGWGQGRSNQRQMDPIIQHLLCARQYPASFSLALRRRWDRLSVRSWVKKGKAGWDFR